MHIIILCAMAHNKNKEVKDDMPGQDGTGPMGRGPMTGRGMGPCGRGIRRGFGRFCYGAKYFDRPVMTNDQEKVILENEMKILQEDLEAIKKRIAELGE